MPELLDIPLTRIDGGVASLADYRGRVLLLVNTASKCGLTRQYAGLEALYRARRGKGLEVLGFPANDFMGQEPGSNAEIAAFCSLNYQLQFPLFAKLSVRGPDQHPLYAALTAAQPQTIGEGPMRERLQAAGIAPGSPPDVLWNFEKFLIGRDGRVAARFAPDVTAEDERLLNAIDAELARPAP